MNLSGQSRVSMSHESKVLEDLSITHTAKRYVEKSEVSQLLLFTSGSGVVSEPRGAVCSSWSQ